MTQTLNPSNHGAVQQETCNLANSASISFIGSIGFEGCAIPRRKDIQQPFPSDVSPVH